MTDVLAWKVVQATHGADFVLVNVGATVGPNWHEALRDAAYADVVIATASALPASALALGDGAHKNTRADAEFDRRPALAHPFWGCVYVRGDALAVAANARWRGTDSN